jgi:hypothetical protein
MRQTSWYAISFSAQKFLKHGADLVNSSRRLVRTQEKRWLLFFQLLLLTFHTAKETHAIVKPGTCRCYRSELLILPLVCHLWLYSSETGQVFQAGETDFMASHRSSLIS